MNNSHETSYVGIKPSVLEQLKSISNNLKELEYYSYDVDADLTDAIFYSKLKDQINEKLKEIEN